MRTIKFRIWDYQKMFYPDTEHFFQNAIFWNIKMTEEKSIDKDLVTNYSLMQFTGCHDKTGKEIFEGDIHRVEIEHSTGDERHYFICTWLKEFGCFSWIDSMNYQDYVDNGLIAIEWMLNDGIPLHLDFEDCKKIEIIGNIHENPELLKQ